MERAGGSTTRQCAFCGENKHISGEHVWPDWARDLLPKRTNKREHLSQGPGGFDSHVMLKDQIRQGSPSSIKIPVVCRTCNNGWMSEIENDAKPYFESLVGGKNRIDRMGRKALSEWFFLKFAVQSSDLRYWTCSKQELKSFKEHRQIPNNFKSWMFVHHTDEWRDTARIYATHAEFIGQNMEVDRDRQNLASYAHGFDRLLFFGMYGHAAPIVLSFPKSQASKLYPMGPSGGLELPTTTLGHHEAGYLLNFLSFHCELGKPLAYINDVVEMGRALEMDGVRFD